MNRNEKGGGGEVGIGHSQDGLEIKQNIALF